MSFGEDSTRFLAQKIEFHGMKGILYELGDVEKPVNSYFKPRFFMKLTGHRCFKRLTVLDSSPWHRPERFCTCWRL
jgi:hypothetical protein